MSAAKNAHPYPGTPAALDGNSAVIACERESSDAAGAFPITPSTQMGELWAQAAADGHLNIAGRPLIFIEPEGEHAAAAVTAGLSMAGLRAANFSSGQGIAYMHESLYAAVGKRLTYVLNMGCRAMTKATLNVHAGHDDYHCVDDTGFFQLFACNAQHAADLNVIAHRIAELALNPGIVAQDGFLTTHLIESVLLPERALIETYLGRPEDVIDSPTPAQRMLFGATRRRVPELWDVDNPIMAGAVQNQDAYMQSVAAQRPYFFEHIGALADRAFAEYETLTGRRYERVLAHRADDARYLILAQGSVVPTAQAVADYLRKARGLEVGVIDLVMFRPFPEARLGELIAGKDGVVVLERLDQPLAADPPIARELRAVVGKCLENGRAKHPVHEGLPAYSKLSDAPNIYSASFGLGSRDLQPEGLIGAIENMLPDGARKPRFYLGIRFLRDSPVSPADEIHEQTIEDAYPGVRALSVTGSENPNLMPPGTIAVRMHSIGGWGAITTGKNMATTLFDLLGLHIKANPKYGSEKKGQPTTFFLAAAPEPIRVNCEFNTVNVVLSPDPNVFNHTNALHGLVDGGTLIIQSDAARQEEVWRHIPSKYQRIIRDRGIRLFALDAFRIAREEATDPELEQRMQGMAFQGAFFAATPLMVQHGLDEPRLIGALRKQLEHKFGDLGARVVEDNLRVIQRGFDEIREITTGEIAEAATGGGAPAVPVRVAALPKSTVPMSDVHGFWARTGSQYARGAGNDNLADPFAAVSVMPASTALFRDMTGIRTEHPKWIPENCTACGKCWTVCPDTALPALVSTLDEVLDTAVARVRRQGRTVTHLPGAVRRLEPHLRQALDAGGEPAVVRAVVDDAIDAFVEQEAPPAETDVWRQEFGWLNEALGDYPFSITRPFYTLPERDAPGTGGLLSITVNPDTCKGCGECVAVCDDDALTTVAQNATTVDILRRRWSVWRDLPSTNDRFVRIDDLDQGIGILDHILLKKEHYLPFTGGDGACLGCSEKTVLHLFTATVEALMRPRVARHLDELAGLLERLERHVQLVIVNEIDIEDTDTLQRIVRDTVGKDLTLAELARRSEAASGDVPIDPEWLTRVTGLIAEIKDLLWRYREGTTGRGRAPMGILNATGCSSVWGSTYPFNPYPFPWANHLFQDSASMAMGVFEAHMAKMARGFRAIRLARAELDGGQTPGVPADFGWRHFTDTEIALCPPVVVVGGDGAMYDIGFQNLSRAMMSGKPLKIVVLDTQVYSNTGGQACTSGFLGQISDMAPFGTAAAGKQEVRKEIGLIAMAHRTTYVAQSTIAHPSHMIESFIEGLRTPRPALFNCYTACQPEHGIGDDMGYHQAKLAVESRAYPLFRYNPDHGPRPADCLDLGGNPSLDRDWPVYTISQHSDGRDQALSVAMTFADFAATETRFRKHFRTVPPDAWHDDMVPLAEFLELADDERADRYPFIWSRTPAGNLVRLRVDDTMVAACQDRRDLWTMLRSLAGLDTPPAPTSADLEGQIRRDLVARLTANLLALTGEAAIEPADAPAPKTEAEIPSEAAANDGYLAPWIDSDACTACDECTNLNPAIFAYNEAGKAYIKDPRGGPYQDLVKAAERCTARVIHPGRPAERTDALMRWIERGEKYN